MICVCSVVLETDDVMVHDGMCKPEEGASHVIYEIRKALDTSAFVAGTR